MTVLIFAAVFYGFGSEYVRFRAEYFPFPSLLVYIHAALFFFWMLLLLTQASLVSAGRVAWHRRLGIAGFSLLCCMPIVGALTVTAAVAHNRFPPGFDGPWVFYYDSHRLTARFRYASLLRASLSKRATNTQATSSFSRRLVIGEAGIFRWPVHWIHEMSHGVTMVTYFFLLLIVVYDFFLSKKNSSRNPVGRLCF